MLDENGYTIGIADLSPEHCNRTWSVHIDISKICPQIEACCNVGSTGELAQLINLIT